MLSRVICPLVRYPGNRAIWPTPKVRQAACVSHFVTPVFIPIGLNETVILGRNLTFSVGN